jgi:hypothetical protein
MGWLLCCGRSTHDVGAVEIDVTDGGGSDDKFFSNPIGDDRASLGERVSAALARVSTSRRSSTRNSEKAEHLLDDHQVLCMVTSHTTNHPDLQWRGRGVRERARIMRQE